MKKLVQSTRCILRTNLWLWLTVVLWAVPVMEAQAADWMKRSDKFYMEYSGSTPEHVTFHVLMCDLDYSNTYAKSEGTIYAESGSSIYYLMDIHYVSEGKDENPYGKVRARIDSRRQPPGSPTAITSRSSNCLSTRKTTLSGSGVVTTTTVRQPSTTTSLLRWQERRGRSIIHSSMLTVQNIP